ncbi:MAG: ankyrin repeat domain-containing protein [Blastocatellia bacterium]|nr:ankyrin repeat domain-containing protein [Blastocatellia bacterium]
MKVIAEALPTRCEVCHQSDCFDPKRNFCSRCEDVSETLLEMEQLETPIRMPFLATYGEEKSSFTTGVAQTLVIWGASVLLLMGGWYLTGVVVYACLFWLVSGCLVVAVVKLVPVPIGTHRFAFENAWTDHLSRYLTRIGTFGLALGIGGFCGIWFIVISQTATCVALAARYNDTALGFVLNLGATVEARDELQRTPLMLVIQDNQAVQRLVEHGADVNASDSKDCTPLMLAASGTDGGILAYLHHRGARLDARDREGNTALFYAAAHNQFPAVRYLNRSEALINAENDEGLTALNLAIRKKADPILIWYLLDAGADYDGGRPALIEAVSSNNLELAGLVLNWEASLASIPDLKTGKWRSGWWPKVNIHATDPKTGDTALMIAAQKGNPAMVKLLLERFVAPHTVNYRTGTTALMYAAKTGNLKSVQLILERLAEMEYAMRKFQGKEGPLSRMERNMFEMSSKRLFEIPDWSVKLHLNQPDKSGHTLLMYAVCNSDTPSRREIVPLLVEKGAEVEVADRQGYTPWVYAGLCQDTYTMKLLEKNGAKPLNQVLLEARDRNPFPWRFTTQVGNQGSQGEDFSLLGLLKK